MEQVTMMVKAMQDAFRENLSFIKWMSPDSANAARAKLEHMADLIGYPTFVLNSTWLDQGNNCVLGHSRFLYLLGVFLSTLYTPFILTSLETKMT